MLNDNALTKVVKSDVFTLSLVTLREYCRTDQESDICQA